MNNERLRVAVVVLASPETHEGFGRVVNGLQLARELADARDEVTIVFDGAGTVAAAALVDPENPAHRLLLALRERVAGACASCAAAFGVQKQLETAGIPLLSEFHRHPSLRQYLQHHYQIVTFSLGPGWGTRPSGAPVDPRYRAGGRARRSSSSALSSAGGHRDRRDETLAARIPPESNERARSVSEITERNAFHD